MMMMKWQLNDQGKIVGKWNYVGAKACQPAAVQINNKRLALAEKRAIAKPNQEGELIWQFGRVAIV